MSGADEEPGKKFWKGQNIFVVLFGGGVVVVPEHHVYGSILIALGALGFAHSIWNRNMNGQSALWIGAILISWTAIGYDVYDRHRGSDLGLPEWDAPVDSALVRTGTTPDSCLITVNGSKFSRYRSDYKLAVGCFATDGSVDDFDVNLQVGNIYDIATGNIAMSVKVNQSFRQFLDGRVNLVLLIVPRDVSISQFTTMRQARALGVKLKRVIQPAKMPVP